MDVAVCRKRELFSCHLRRGYLVYIFSLRFRVRKIFSRGQLRTQVSPGFTVFSLVFKVIISKMRNLYLQDCSLKLINRLLVSVLVLVNGIVFINGIVFNRLKRFKIKCLAACLLNFKK